ncbi:MAG: hypothetical protein A2X36_14560 [Elusimicrobia bacterium GWA2_69_24]|nr:MAG: hypothetical protein A2X36_14560 [Elusimicrobia bacterium GWA2_69_24]HBL18384.1 hypothetical protein [Elusimicrobiota bacterium]
MPPRAEAGGGPPWVSVVVPTYNEAQSVPILLERLEGLLCGTPHEIIVADDDSPDRTWEVAERLTARVPGLRVLRRSGERGLYPAVLEGFASSSGEWLLVMDADLQHDETIIPAMLETARLQGPGVVIGSRYAAGGGVEDWSRTRLWGSRVATALARAVLRVRVADPMSGFFAVHRDVYRTVLPRLRPKGFKILFDILQHLPEGAPASEVPYVFRNRKLGASKLNGEVAWCVLTALASAGWNRFRAS